MNYMRVIVAVSLAASGMLMMYNYPRLIFFGVLVFGIGYFKLIELTEKEEKETEMK